MSSLCYVSFMITWVSISKEWEFDKFLFRKWESDKFLFRVFSIFARWPKLITDSNQNIQNIYTNYVYDMDSICIFNT